MDIKIDNIIQIERLRHAKICGERRLFHNLINNCSGKSENLKPQGSLRVLFLLCFLFRSSPSKRLSKVAVLKISQKFIGNTRGAFVLVAGHRPSYLQQRNYAACCPWNFEAVISRNIFD